MSVEFSHVLFDVGTARARVFTAETVLESDDQERTYSQDILDRGTIQPWAGSLSAKSKGV